MTCQWPVSAHGNTYDGSLLRRIWRFTCSNEAKANGSCSDWDSRKSNMMERTSERGPSGLESEAAAASQDLKRPRGSPGALHPPLSHDCCSLRVDPLLCVGGAAALS